MAKNKYELPAPKARRVVIVTALTMLALGILLLFDLWQTRSTSHSSVLPEVGYRIADITKSKFFLFFGIFLAVLALWSLIDTLRPRKNPYRRITVQGSELDLRPLDIARYISGQMSTDSSKATTTVSKKKVVVDIDADDNDQNISDDDFQTQAEQLVSSLGMDVDVSVKVKRVEDHPDE